MMSRSPAVRTSVLSPTVVRSGCGAWLISKSKLVVPDRLLRVQASCEVQVPADELERRGEPTEVGLAVRDRAGPDVDVDVVL